MKRAFTVLVSGMFLCVVSVGVAFAQPAGKAIVNNACTKCHSIKRVESAKKNASEWEATLDRMIKKGAKVTPGERETVLKYLNTLNK
jgi:cytochrome c5